MPSQIYWINKDKRQAPSQNAPNPLECVAKIKTIKVTMGIFTRAYEIITTIMYHVQFMR